MIYKILPLALFCLSSFTTNKTFNTDPKLVANTTESTSTMKIESVYSSLHANNKALPKMESFTNALNGFYRLKAKGLVKKNILTLIDFSLSSTSKRLWVIDLSTNTVLINTFVSHGMKSGLEYATSFSNTEQSNKSSLGFYATGESYIGKHGLSLRLDGLEKGINDRARGRDIVVHGAYYSSPKILKSQGYLGRSQGCPAIPSELSKEIINTIKNKSCLFIYHPSRNYKTISKLIA
jgi:L,D-transpeptidase catalytic domain